MCEEASAMLSRLVTFLPYLILFKVDKLSV